MRIKNSLNLKVRKTINRKNIQRLKNRDFSLVASNCNGSLILHDLGLRFNSPFVNLWLKPKDYIKMLSNFEWYMNQELKFVKEDGIDYPIGIINEVRIYFQHYNSEDEAKTIWQKRKERINFKNLFVMFTERDGCKYEDLKAFDELPFNNKIVFTKKEYPDIKSSFYIKGFEDQPCVGFLYEFMPNKLGYKYYDQFDYVSWFNMEL